MNIYDALRKRKSTRAFLDKPVSREKLVNILRAARHAPSGTNAQPWQVAVVTGRKKDELAKAMTEAFKKDGIGTMDYQYYPQNWKEPYKKRRVSCGAQLYSALNIERRDRAGRLRQWAANYRAFDAPVMLLFFMDGGMQTGSFMDYGMFIQSIMLAAMEKGLATCPQASLAQYPDIVRSELGYDDSMQVVCGMALGY